MAPLRRPRPPVVPDQPLRHRASPTGGVTGLLVVELVLGAPVESSCFLLPPLGHLVLSVMLLVSLVIVSVGSMPSAVPLVPHRGPPPPGPQGLSAALVRGSVWGTTWFLPLTSTPAQTSSHRRAAGEAAASCQQGDKESTEEGVEGITVMTCYGGRVGGGGQVEEVEEETAG